MIGREFRFHDGKKGAALAVRIIKNSKEDMIRKVLKDGTVVVHLKGNPEDPKALLIRYLSSELHMDRGRFDIIELKDGVDMLLSILDIRPGEIQNLILDKIA
jgi:uncharacterized protein YggU (UPF0235/DUF167 family)